MKKPIVLIALYLTFFRTYCMEQVLQKLHIMHHAEHVHGETSLSLVANVKHTLLLKQAAEPLKDDVSQKLSACAELEIKLQQYSNYLTDQAAQREKELSFNQIFHLKENASCIKKDGKDPIHVMAYTHDVIYLNEILPLLRKLELAEKVLNIANKYGETPLSHASCFCAHEFGFGNTPEILKLLVDNGANPNKKTKDDYPIYTLFEKIAVTKKTPKELEQLDLAVKYLIPKMKKNILNSFLKDSGIPAGIKNVIKDYIELNSKN